jgi:hypothetical protein
MLDQEDKLGQTHCYFDRALTSPRYVYGEPSRDEDSSTREPERPTQWESILWRKSILWPHERLLGCSKTEIPFAAHRAIDQIEELDTEMQSVMLDWLSHQLNTPWAKVPLWNRIGAMEVLARFKSPGLPSLIETALNSPDGEHNLYTISMARVVRPKNTSLSDSIANRITVIYESSHRDGRLTTEWGRRLSVEVFRTLSELSPNHAVGPICRLLPAIAATEITAVLEAVTRAAHVAKQVDKTDHWLDDAIRILWDRYNSTTNNSLNRPGVISCLLELTGVRYHSLDDALCVINLHESKLRAQILYLFAKRPLDFLDKEQSLHCYSAVFDALIRTQQNHELEEVISKAMTEASGDRGRMLKIWSEVNKAIDSLQRPQTDQS